MAAAAPAHTTRVLAPKSRRDLSSRRDFTVGSGRDAGEAETLITSRPAELAAEGGDTETLYHRDALLYIAYVMLIWAVLIPADRWHCSLWP